MRIFSMFKKKTLILMIFNDFNNCMVLGPRFPGDMGPSCFRDVLKSCFMVWEPSRSVRMMFRSPGNPLINLFHLLFNSKCHFFKVNFLSNCLLNCLLHCLLNCLLNCLLYSCVPRNKPFNLVALSLSENTRSRI